MPTLVDTNVLARRSQRHHPMNPLATAALDLLLGRGESLCVTPQNLMEYWAVATRPTEVNGLGLSPEEADTELEDLERIFELLPETAAVYNRWREIVRSVGANGRQVHDAHLVASSLSAGVTEILTFNDADFRRYPGITAVHPSQVKRVS